MRSSRCYRQILRLAGVSTRRLHVVCLFSLLAFIGPFTSGQATRDLEAAPQVRFTNVDLMVDPHGIPMAAYQVEFIADPARVKLVGIEGGSHSAYKKPPYYDAKALAGNRVILAALNTGSDLPKDKTRVARLHLWVMGAAKPELSAKLVVAASSTDQKIPADVTILEGAIP